MSGEINVATYHLIKMVKRLHGAGDPNVTIYLDAADFDAMLEEDHTLRLGLVKNHRVQVNGVWVCKRLRASNRDRGPPPSDEDNVVGGGR